VRTVLVPSLVVLVLSTLLASPTHAVELEGFGVKAGGAFQFHEFTFEGTDGLDDESRTGLVAGVSTIWQLQRRSAFRFVVEALYVQKGYQGTREIQGTINEEPTDVDVGADYLSVPVLGRVLFAEDDLSVYAVFGPSFEFLLSNDEDLLLDEFSSWSMALNVGLGAEYELGRTKAQFELRFSRDVLNNFDGDEDIYRLDDVFHQMLFATAGLRF